MISYNFKILNEKFTSLSEILHTNISVYDDHFEGANVQNSINVSICNYFHENIHSSCSLSDYQALNRASKSNEPFHYSCHFGFEEIMIPFNVDQSTRFYVLIGPFRNENNGAEMENKIQANAIECGKDPNIAITKYHNMPVLNETVFLSITDIVNSLIDYALKVKWITIRDDFIENDLNPYLKEHISETILTNDIAAHFYYTNKQLEKLVKEHTGMNPKKYILLFKMNVAKEMLVSSSDSLQSISEFVGFDDYNYFIKVFKSFNKETPLKYRKKFSIQSFNNK